MLVTTFGESSITRLDDVTLRLHRDTGFFEGKMHTLARGRSQPFRDGDSVALPDMKATVTETTSDGRPRTIEFRFNSTLESPHWLWMRGSGMSLVDLTPPQLGETVVIGVAS